MIKLRCPRCGGTKHESGHGQVVCKYCKYSVQQAGWSFWGVALAMIAAGVLLFLLSLAVIQPTASAVVWYPVVYFLCLAVVLVMVKTTVWR